SPILYASNQIDVTQEIVRLYDQEHPVKAGTAAPRDAKTAPTQTTTARPTPDAPQPGPAQPSHCDANANGETVSAIIYRLVSTICFVQAPPRVSGAFRFWLEERTRAAARREGKRNGRHIGLEFDIVGKTSQGGLYAPSKIANGKNPAPTGFCDACRGAAAPQRTACGSVPSFLEVRLRRRRDGTHHGARSGA